LILGLGTIPIPMFAQLLAKRKNRNGTASYAVYTCA